MAGVGRKLPRAADADIGPPLVDDWRRRAHRRRLRIIDAVIQLQTIAPGNNRAAVFLFDRHTVEAAALRGEIIGVCRFIIGDGAADIAVKIAPRIQLRTGCRVEQVEIRASGLTVICAHHHEIITHIRASPIETAVLHMPPRGIFRLIRPARILVCQRQADEAAVAGLTVPEAGIGIAV